jgi:cell division protein FtsB
MKLNFNHYTLFSALAISVVAAYYSISGLVAIFPGAALAIILMGGFLENGKLVGAVWLHRNWGDKEVIPLTVGMSVSVLVLMLITSLGIFGFLSKAHTETTQVVDTNEIEKQFVQTQIDTVKKQRVTYDAQIKQLDETTQKYIDIGYMQKSIQVAAEQEERREALVAKVDDLVQKEITLQRKLAEIQTEAASIEKEVGPIKYVAQAIYKTKGHDAVEKAVMIVMYMLIVVFDPLAVMLLIAAQHGFAKDKLARGEPEPSPDPERDKWQKEWDEATSHYFEPTEEEKAEMRKEFYERFKGDLEFEKEADELLKEAYENTSETGRKLHTKKVDINKDT